MPRPIAHIHPEPYRILLVGNETLGSEEVVASLDGRAADAEVLVVAPALATAGALVRTITRDAPPSGGSPRASRHCARRASPRRGSSGTPSRSPRSRTRCASSRPTRS